MPAKKKAGRPAGSTNKPQVGAELWTLDTKKSSYTITGPYKVMGTRLVNEKTNEVGYVLKFEGKETTVTDIDGYHRSLDAVIKDIRASIT